LYVQKEFGLLPLLGVYKLLEPSINFVVPAVYMFLPSLTLAARFDIYCPFMQELFKCNITKLESVVMVTTNCNSTFITAIFFLRGVALTAAYTN